MIWEIIGLIMGILAPSEPKEQEEEKNELSKTTANK